MEVPVELIAKFKQWMIDSCSENLGKEYGHESFDVYSDLYRATQVAIDCIHKETNKYPSLEEVVYILQNSFEHLYTLTISDMDEVERLYAFHIEARN